jgi:cell wall-associated NlpC family hydrolase
VNVRQRERLALSLHLARGKRLAFIMRMRRSLTSALVICGTFGALCISPARAAAASRPQQAFSVVAALDSLTAAIAPASAPTLPNVTAPRAPSAARAIGARNRARLDSVVAVARAQLGTRYRLGGESPRAFDCSGLVQYVMRALDYSLPRTAREQAKIGTAIPTDTAQLRAGDLLLFGRKGKVTHIGIYVGNGQFVHASTGAKRVVERPLLRKPARGIVPWIGARRLFAIPDDSTLAQQQPDSTKPGGL